MPGNIGDQSTQGSAVICIGAKSTGFAFRVSSNGGDPLQNIVAERLHAHPLLSEGHKGQYPLFWLLLVPIDSHLLAADQLDGGPFFLQILILIRFPD
jgi:hypothetical protein